MDRSELSALASDLRATLGMLKRRLRERASLDDLTPSQTDVLRWLHHHDQATVSRLARECGLRPQSMATIVATLQARGLVAGASDPQDGRQVLIRLTPLCRDRISQGRAAREDWLASRIEQLSAEQQEQLRAAASLLRRIAEP